MLPAFILGLILLVLVILVTRWVADVDPRQLLRLLGWTGGGLAVIVVVFLAVSGRLAWAVALFAALLPWIGRLLWGIALGRVLKHTLGSLGGGPSSSGGGGFSPVGGGRTSGRWARGGASGDGRSEVTTRFLRMTLDHETGAMDGVVLDGPSAGRTLADLDRAALATLWRATAADTDSRRVLEAWLDRTHADWRDTMTDEENRAEAGPDPDRRESASAFGTGPMSHAEARAILGLDDGADADAIQDAWRRLMRGVHPDHGGSPYLAARLNQAREVLLGRSSTNSRR